LRRCEETVSDPHVIEVVGSDQEETAMIGNKALVALAIAAATGVLGAASALAKDDDSERRGERGGWVVPCSLSGVNPALHPEIFGDPAVAAREFGFVKSRDGTWHVQDNCFTRSQGLPENKKR
jgi:hypothetical protein